MCDNIFTNNCMIVNPGKRQFSTIEQREVKIKLTHKV